LIHFVGIGGIGMSGLALIMDSLGFKVQGSDISDNKNLNLLRKRKIPIYLMHSKQNIKNCTLLVVSSAIKKSNPEYMYAKKLNLPIYKRGELLGHIVSLMKNIVVTGSHGKTTTTSILSNILSYAKLDPTIINGGVLNSIGSSAQLGKSDWSLVESDESDGSFLRIPFNYSIVTNVDNEHLDYYKTMKNLKNKFIEFINKTPSFGKAFLCLDDKNLKNILPKLKNNNYYTFGINQKSNFHIFNVIQNRKCSKFSVRIKIPGKTKIINNISIPLLGLHNIKNAASALAVAFSIGVSDKIIKLGLKNFNGVQRRFNFIFEINKVPFFDDYAHHPTEISSVLDGVSKVYNKEDIVCIFQPHRISRVKNLTKEFSKCFAKANTILLCPIYKAGENIKLGFSYNSFANLIAKNSDVNLIMIKNELELKKVVKNIAYGNKVFIAMGAGSISNWVRKLN
ncbi:UDP-N-acetylmuramate--L-alanine ligase, partial [Candidatus Pelagibacter sp.]|nr:UDP-N-acetylmuramate--L-alanine ligase [Candidatus Pelagibacter sp.]